MVWRRWLLVVLGARAHAHYQAHEKWLWWEVQGRAGTVLVAYEEHLNGGGLAFGMDLVRYAYNAVGFCLLYTSPSPRDATLSRMPSSA